MTTRKGATDDLIRAVLEEDLKVKEQKKRAKRSNGRLPNPATIIESDLLTQCIYHSVTETPDTAGAKRAAVDDVADVEGGPIKENMVAAAQKKRTAKRRVHWNLETDLVEDVEAIEEELQAEKHSDDEIPLEAFNLKEERERGYFDESSGAYIERKDSEDEQDAWFHIEGAQVVSEDVLRKIEEQQRALSQKDQSPPQPLSEVQIARLQWQISQILQSNESVTKALKRLGPGQRMVGKMAREAIARAEPEKKKMFDELTECASVLMDVGHTEVYSQRKEDFAKAAAKYIDIDENEGEGQQVGMLPEAGKAAYEEADEDMFADDSKQEGQQQEDFSSWPVKDLKKFLEDKGIDSHMYVEKAELVAEAARAACLGQRSHPVPLGYSYDAESGYWYSSEQSMYFDQASGLYYRNERWYAWDSSHRKFDPV